MGQQGSTSKADNQVAGEDGEDRLSSLPECLIANILSFMPTKNAVRTSVLSKAWRTAWTLTTNLDFSDKELPRGPKLTTKSKYRFLQIVHRVLRNCTSPNLTNFEMKCLQRYDQISVQNWVSNIAARHELRRFSINCCINGNVAFPDNIFTNQTLEEMELILPCTLNLPVVTAFRNLKVLFLSKVQLVNGNNSEELMFDLPALTDLVFLCCIWRDVKAIEIRAPVLLKFQMSWCRYELGGRELNMVEKIRVNLAHCTKLSKFKWAGYLIEKINLPNPSSVSHALMDHTIESNDYYQTGKVTANLLTMLKSIVHLELSLDAVEAMELVERLDDLPIFENLTSMKVESRFTSGRRILMDLLKKTPNLRDLDLHIQSLMWGPDDFDEMQDLELPVCVKMSLEKVCFTCRLRGIVGIGFIMLFLRNAQRLENLQFNAPEFEDDWKMQYKVALDHAPKASTNVTIEVPL